MIASPNTPMVVIVGPTASGKSALAMHIAELFGGEVLACDSTQLYRLFNIGTAKPTEAERRRVPHHLIDLYDPEQISTAGEYRRQAIRALEDLRRRASLPILTVGTGLYLRALLEGLAEAPLRSEVLRARLSKKSARNAPDYLHRVLMRLDRETAARIAPRDHQKLIRAIEVCMLTGKRISDVHRSGRAPLEGFRPITIGLAPPRAELKTRIAGRITAMLDQGWLEEVRQLVAGGLPEHCKPFDFIGYRELRAHLSGSMSLEDAVANIEQATRRYAKRQLTWFRKVPDVHWYAGFGDSAAIQAAVSANLKAALPNPAARATAAKDV
jgi:tRNA dimethylallyltransferase